MENSIDICNPNPRVSGAGELRNALYRIWYTVDVERNCHHISNAFGPHNEKRLIEYSIVVVLVEIVNKNLIGSNSAIY